MDNVLILLSLGVEIHPQVARIVVVRVGLHDFHLALIGEGVVLWVPAPVTNVLFELFVDLGIVTPVIGLVVTMAVTMRVMVVLGGVRVVGGHCVGGETEAEMRREALGGQDFAEEHVFCLNLKRC